MKCGQYRNRIRVRRSRYRLCVKKEHCKGNVSGGSRCSETRLEGHGCLRAHQYGYDPALDEVGKGFEAGTVFLPQLLMSAEAAKAAFAS